MRPKRTHCAYCGCRLADLPKPERTRDHVPPDGIFPKSLAGSKVQWVTVPACLTCHAAFSDDDAHFRNILPLCGEVPPPLMRELWKNDVLRALSAKDGGRRLDDLLKIMRLDDSGRIRIWPEEDPAFIRVLVRITRALCWHHDCGWPVKPEDVQIERLRYAIPPEFLKDFPGGQSPGNIFEWRFIEHPEDGPRAATVLMIFRGNMAFLGNVGNT